MAENEIISEESWRKKAKVCEEINEEIMCNGGKIWRKMTNNVA